MTEDYVIRKYQISEENQIIELLNNAFDYWPPYDLTHSVLEHWKWKYIENSSGKYLLIVAEKDGEVVGFNSQIFTNLKVGNKTILSGLFTELGVHPDHRRKGISNNMVKFMKKIREDMETRIHFGFSSNPIVIKAELKRGKKYFPHDLKLMISINDYDSYLKSNPGSRLTNYVMRQGFRLKRYLDTLINSLTLNTTSKTPFQIRKMSSFNEDVDIFWDTIKDHYLFITERKMNHLNWRYADPRGGNYDIKAAYDENRIVGYIVTRINNIEKDHPVGFIVDLITIPNRIDIADKLIDSALQDFMAKKITTLKSLVVKNHPYEGIYKKHGFSESRIQYAMTIELMYFDEEWDEILKMPADRVLISYCDTDRI